MFLCSNSQAISQNAVWPLALEDEIPQNYENHSNNLAPTSFLQVHLVISALGSTFAKEYLYLFCEYPRVTIKKERLHEICRVIAMCFFACLLLLVSGKPGSSFALIIISSRRNSEFILLKHTTHNSLNTYFDMATNPENSNSELCPVSPEVLLLEAQRVWCLGHPRAQIYL